MKKFFTVAILMAIIIAINCVVGVTANAENKTSVLVNKSYHLLFVLKENTITDVVPVSIGKGGESETPTGNFTIVSIVHNPKWYFNGKVYPPYIEDPENGLGVCWIGISLPSYGIHGTNEPLSPGRNRSHGCVRMNNSDILKISKESFIGESVTIINGNKSVISNLLKPINLLYDTENILQNSE